jgi:hypothetical protein
LLAFVGGALGVLCAHWGTALLTFYLPDGTTAPDLTPDVRVLGFAVALTGATGILSGLFAALRSSRIDLAAAMKRQWGTTTSGRVWSIDSVLVVTQIALSFVLLATAALFATSLRNLRGIDAGPVRGNLMRLTVHPSPEFAGQRGIDLYRRIVAELAALPGVRSATMSAGELLHGEGHARFSVPGYVPKPDEILTASDTGVGPRFFQTTGIRLLRGRDFDARDFAAGLPKVAVINETMARHFFGESDPIGQRFKRGSRTQLSEIIGVARDLKYYDHLRRATPFAIYQPFAQDPDEAQSMTFLIRTVAEPTAMATTVTDLVRRIEPTLRIADVHTMDSWIDRQLVRERALAHLSASFSIFAVMLDARKWS